MRTPFVLVVLVACATIAAGCGSSERDDGASIPATSEQTTQPAPSGLLGEVRQRLEAAGYNPETRDVSGAAAGLDVSGTAVTAYASAAEAQRSYREIERIFARQPGQGVAEVAGERVYFYANESRLTADERERFAKLVATAEGTGP